MIRAFIRLSSDISQISQRLAGHLLKANQPVLNLTGDLAPQMLFLNVALHTPNDVHDVLMNFSY
jgi:hypothetical protein